MSARHIVCDVFLWLGVLLCLIACLGTLVMRDPLDRVHFSGPASLGALSIAVAVVVQDSFSLVGDKALLVAAFIVVVSPVLNHATARAARMAHRGDWRLSDREPVEIEEP